MTADGHLMSSDATADFASPPPTPPPHTLLLPDPPTQPRHQKPTRKSPCRTAAFQKRPHVGPPKAPCHCLYAVYIQEQQSGAHDPSRAPPVERPDAAAEADQGRFPDAAAPTALGRLDRTSVATARAGCFAGGRGDASGLCDVDRPGVERAPVIDREICSAGSDNGLGRSGVGPCEGLRCLVGGEMGAA
ncbi:hypothetical protein DFQ28_010541 [Apophysomyces sp. BC1034]|nr:hypothetical protein DFQ30_006873 [Apophysomyces sp. BC1015]KAG0172762.1 hypothetical protein DFQ29_008229 [Apophysomyces sp. BC1021]KAG0184750.1 hypothetical protein DFQ28_010541 [Apophysomyces sp. BC1034]